MIVAQEDPLVAALHATCGVDRQTPQMAQDIQSGSIQRRTTRGRAWLAIAVATLIMIGIIYGEIWTLERGFSSTTACYVALSNDIVSLMSLDEMDFAATNPTCGH